MKTSIISAIVLAALSVSAAPSSGKNNGRNRCRTRGNNGRDRDCDLRDYPFEFTSDYRVVATPGQVVDTNNVRTGGLPGAIGFYNYGINSDENVICYNITLYGFRGEYQSAANTATHIHQARKGLAGPPRIAIPNPQVVPGNPDKRVSLGCLTGPFTTGIVVNGADTGAGFTVSQIEDNPKGFFTDVHSSLAVPGAVRGQLS
ncbi:hypothetical protein LTS18_015063 [Coniosporium uncinatum]|uniref:Uncharacterized protein n=1 Tax=Coniosporium uncinatum TaxID=93489 RepID=A0ACC3D8H4_9PEZI|nr:hypothetical protein LTS18_015063 [Coniosporium uncinatum]